MKHTHILNWTVTHKKNRAVVKIDPQIVGTGDDIVMDPKATTAPIALFFSDASLTGQHQYVVQPGKPLKIKVLAQKSQWALYTYAAYYVEYGTFAEGSSPIIIVKP